MEFGLPDISWMNKGLCYHAVTLPGSQQLRGESLNYVHITKEGVEYLKISSSCAFTVL